VYFSGGRRAERVKGLVLFTSMLRNVVKKIVYVDRTIALQLKVEEVSVFGCKCTCRCRSRLMMK